MRNLSRNFSPEDFALQHVTSLHVDSVTAATYVDKIADKMKLLTLVCFLPAAAALGYCNDKDLQASGINATGAVIILNAWADFRIWKAKLGPTFGV